MVVWFRNVNMGGQKNAGDQALCGDRTSGRLPMPGEAAGTSEQNKPCSHQGELRFMGVLSPLFSAWAFILWEKQDWVLYIHRISFLLLNSTVKEALFPPLSKWGNGGMKRLHNLTNTWNTQDSSLTPYGFTAWINSHWSDSLPETSLWHVNSIPRGPYYENRIDWHAQRTKVTIYTWNAQVVSHLTKDYTQAIHNTILINSITLS